MEVLRVEDHAHGTGPYQLDLGGSTSYNQPTRPDPYADIPAWSDENREGWYFGFSNLEQLFRWWNVEEVKTMLVRGLQVSTYEVPKHKVVVGGCQVAFLRSCATYVKTCKLPEED